MLYEISYIYIRERGKRGGAGGGGVCACFWRALADARQERTRRRTVENQQLGLSVPFGKKNQRQLGDGAAVPIESGAALLASPPVIGS